MNLGGGRVETRALGKVYQTARVKSALPELITEGHRRQTSRRWIRFVPEKGTPDADVPGRPYGGSGGAIRFRVNDGDFEKGFITSVRSRSR